ncbi:hypothetical protein D3C81_1821810 [compost metagenome]
MRWLFSWPLRLSFSLTTGAYFSSNAFTASFLTRSTSPASTSFLSSRFFTVASALMAAAGSVIPSNPFRVLSAASARSR